MQQLAVGDLPALAARAKAEGAAPLLVLDVREAWEFALARLDVATAVTRHLPLSRLAECPGELDDMERSQPVVCVCHHGVRSAQVAAFLQRRGFATVYNLAGGIHAWSLQVDAAVARY